MTAASSVTATEVTPAEVLAFWFSERAEPFWFKRDAAFDAEIERRFGAAATGAAAGARDAWAETADGALALIILLDQFRRNLHRGSADAFAADPKARAIAAGVLEAGLDEAMTPNQRLFLYLPFEHSEDLADQERALGLFGGLPDPDGRIMKSAVRHHEIIARFGRFPHRNAALGRASTAAELTFLEEPNSSF